MDHYPYGLDFAWLAVDGLDRVAVFTNAGQGPIPVVVLSDYERGIRAESLIRELPPRGDARLLIALPRPDDYEGFARRGLFAYDWHDVHRTANHTKAYDLLAIPSVPLSLAELPEQLRELASHVRFAAVRFGEASHLPVADTFECR